MPAMPKNTLSVLVFTFVFIFILSTLGISFSNLISPYETATAGISTADLANPTDFVEAVNFTLTNNGTWSTLPIELFDLGYRIRWLNSSSTCNASIDGSECGIWDNDCSVFGDYTGACKEVCPSTGAFQFQLYKPKFWAPFGTGFFWGWYWMYPPWAKETSAMDRDYCYSEKECIEEFENDDLWTHIVVREPFLKLEIHMCEQPSRDTGAYDVEVFFRANGGNMTTQLATGSVDVIMARGQDYSEPDLQKFVSWYSDLMILRHTYGLPYFFIFILQIFSILGVVCMALLIRHFFSL